MRAACKAGCWGCRPPALRLARALTPGLRFGLWGGRLWRIGRRRIRLRRIRLRRRLRRKACCRRWARGGRGARRCQRRHAKNCRATLGLCLRRQLRRHHCDSCIGARISGRGWSLGGGGLLGGGFREQFSDRFGNLLRHHGAPIFGRLPCVRPANHNVGRLYRRGRGILRRSGGFLRREFGFAPGDQRLDLGRQLSGHHGLVVRRGFDRDVLRHHWRARSIVQDHRAEAQCISIAELDSADDGLLVDKSARRRSDVFNHHIAVCVDGQTGVSFLDARTFDHNGAGRIAANHRDRTAHLKGRAALSSELESRFGCHDLKCSGSALANASRLRARVDPSCRPTATRRRRCVELRR